MDMINMLKDFFKKSLISILAFTIMFESINLGYDTINLIGRPKARIEYLAQEMRKAEENTFKIKFERNPKIITSCNVNALYTLRMLKSCILEDDKENYLMKRVDLLFSPLAALYCGFNLGQYHPKEDLLFINGGNAAIFFSDNRLKGIIAHEEAHAYIEGKRKGLSKKIHEGLADYMAKKTLNEMGINYNGAYKKEHKQVNELMKRYKNIDEFLENVEK